MKKPKALRGYSDIHIRDAGRLKYRLKHVPFHAERADKVGDRYWLRLARGIIDYDGPVDPIVLEEAEGK
ncbi:hypothetical protein AWR36_006075 [Microbulbifer flavimaris]|uniref:Uncharacterized protein n=1 Tax=Microbulbifer flavimaris TaxID=1781068 RepID=A0ABX4HZQ9_9GAMM|nr:MULTISPECIES: hypothetical protein [Microbulbifer]KUJ83425.1 hypothetical protein AVO43_06060 [Microbulbifer sp. ZGT114]PCO05581.1 hypothetical protein AWR36_006075 [Microbulbifer flavimaris]